MYKELSISILIIVAIIFGNNITQEYTKEAVSEISNGLSEIREMLILNDEEIDWKKTQEKMENIQKIWGDKYEKLAYYIEHNELEKVEISLTGLKSYTKKEDASEALNQVDSSMFLLKHIQEKNSVDLKNVF